MRQEGRKMEREWWFRKLYYTDPVSQPLVQLWELTCPQGCDIPHLRRWKRSEAVDNRRHSQSLLLLMEMVSFSLSSHNVFIVTEHKSCGTNMNPSSNLPHGYTLYREALLCHCICFVSF